ncbi:Myosin class II heavy chain (ISS) [Dorcoceras hygrometricum]|nr:Myosin class II heavy chain (ISS) [Dorcoceras hygrometricum]
MGCAKIGRARRDCRVTLPDAWRRLMHGSTMARAPPRANCRARPRAAVRRSWRAMIVALAGQRRTPMAGRWSRRLRGAVAHDVRRPRDVARGVVRRRRDLRGCGAGRRSGDAPASFRRCRDGWSDSFQGLVRACPGQPVKFSGREQALAHGLKWTRTCCSKIVEGRPRDRGAIISRTNTNIPSTCWLRTMIRVDGVWVVEPFCDQWVNIPRPIVCTEVSKQRSFVDFFPTVSEPLRILRKRWADICLEIVEFCASRRPLPVGSLHFCRSLSVVEPVFRVAPRQSLVFAMRISQFCSVFIDFSLFSWLPTVDITDFISSIALERTALHQIQRYFASSVAPHVQLLDEQSSSSSSSDESMNFFDTPAYFSLPATASTTPDVTEALNQLRASIEQLRERYDGGAKNKDTLLLHLHNFEKQVIARLDAQDRVLGALRRDSNDQRNLLSLELQSSHKHLGTQIVTTGLDVVDVRRVVKESHQELNSRINSLDEQVAATRHDLLEFSAQAQQTLSIITSQLSELVAYINRVVITKRGKVAAAVALYLLLFIKVKELVML